MEKSTFAEAPADPGAGLSAAETLVIEVALVPAFNRPHPQQVKAKANAKTTTSIRMFRMLLPIAACGNSCRIRES